MSGYITKEFNGIPEAYICLGYVSGIFGVRGEVKLFLYNPKSDLFNIRRRFFLLDNKQIVSPVELKVRSGAGKKIIGKITGYSNRNEVEKLVGQQLVFLKSDLPPLPDGEWYHHQLLGLAVKTSSGIAQGHIVEIIPGEVDIWVCESEEHRIFIPHTEEDIISVSLQDGVTIPDIDLDE